MPKRITKRCIDRHGNTEERNLSDLHSPVFRIFAAINSNSDTPAECNHTINRSYIFNFNLIFSICPTNNITSNAITNERMIPPIPSLKKDG
jgi:hypothetical protein